MQRACARSLCQTTVVQLHSRERLQLQARLVQVQEEMGRERGPLTSWLPCQRGVYTQSSSCQYLSSWWTAQFHWTPAAKHIVYNVCCVVKVHQMCDVGMRNGMSLQLLTCIMFLTSVLYPRDFVIHWEE